MPYSSHSARTARTLATLTGWPPAMFTVTARETYGMRSAPCSSKTRRSLATSTLPLKGLSSSGSCASSTMTSTKRPPASSWCSRVVVKYMLPGITSPGLMSTWLMMCSAPRPWCVGTTKG